MTRENIIVIAVVSAFLLCAQSCGREAVCGDELPSVNVCFDARLNVKAGVDDRKVSSLDILVFREGHDELELYSRANSSYAKVKVPAAVPLHYVLIANAPAGTLNKCYSLSALDRQLTKLSDVQGNGFIMRGEGYGDFVVKDDLQVVSVELYRYASKVRLSGITVQFMEHSSFASVSIDRVFLINVCGNETLNRIPYADAQSSSWYNRMNVDPSLPSSVNGLLVRNVNQTVTTSAKVSAVYDFYCMPNPTDNDVNYSNSPVWSTRDTRLVVEMTIGGKKNYYPVDIPAMASNTMYQISNLVITGYGSSHPDVPVRKEELSFSILISKWESEEIESDFDVNQDD